jgi:hypothetical protein
LIRWSFTTAINKNTKRRILTSWRWSGIERSIPRPIHHACSAQARASRSRGQVRPGWWGADHRLPIPILHAEPSSPRASMCPSEAAWAHSTTPTMSRGFPLSRHYHWIRLHRGSRSHPWAPHNSSKYHSRANIVVPSAVEADLEASQEKRWIRVHLGLDGRRKKPVLIFCLKTTIIPFPICRRHRGFQRPSIAARSARRIRTNAWRGTSATPSCPYICSILDSRISCTCMLLTKLNGWSRALFALLPAKWKSTHGTKTHVTWKKVDLLFYLHNHCAVEKIKRR